MRAAIDLNEPEIDLNECEHFLKVNQSDIQVGPFPSWIASNVNAWSLRFTVGAECSLLNSSVLNSSYKTNSRNVDQI